MVNSEIEVSRNRHETAPTCKYIDLCNQLAVLSQWHL